MNRSKTNNHALRKPDSRGRIRPYVGVMPDGGKARFTVGDKRTSSVEAAKLATFLAATDTQMRGVVPTAARTGKIGWSGKKTNGCTAQPAAMNEALQPGRVHRAEEGAAVCLRASAAIYSP
jgi:hypothetical protein